ncbi:MAG: lipid A biosynthesis lauroyl acyltransferase [Hyphomicrobiales bacterium]|nr:lipid A biosynthesis lauroyl acyltransferase [Hyphomicrobiales bacterium]
MTTSRQILLRLAAIGDWLFAQLFVALLRLIRLLPVDTALAIGGFFAGMLGRFLPADKTGYDNLRAAYPDLDEGEIRKILAGAWDSIGRVGVEYVFLDRIFDFDPENPNTGRIEAQGVDQFIEIANSDRPCIVFTAHLANWELLAVCAATFNLDLSVLYRPPNNMYVARKLDEVRGSVMGDRIASRDGALIGMSAVLDRGGHIGMLVDQRFDRGPDIPFFGRPARTNPSLAKLARRFDARVYAARSIRLPDNRFRLELKGPLDLPRDADGEVDVRATTEMVTNIVEDWVREHPDQWLWMHNRWRHRGE